MGSDCERFDALRGPIEQVHRYIDDTKCELSQFLAEMIRVQSVNPIFLNEPNGGELECQRFLQSWLTDLGCETELWEPDADRLAKAYKNKPGFVPGRTFHNRPNLTARLPGRGDGSGILLTGHIDVVAAKEEGWAHPPFSGHEERDLLYGRGTVDMKGGLAAMLWSMAAIRQTKTQQKGDVWFGSVVDEEAGGMGTLALADWVLRAAIPASAAVVGEPTNLHIAPLSRGILWGEVVVHGRSGHIEVAQPHWSQGGAVDAIEKAMRLVREIDDLNALWSNTPAKNHPLLPRPCSVRIAQIEGGHSPTSYSDRCRLVLNIQYLPSEQDAGGSGTSVKREVEAFLRAVTGVDPWLRDHPPEINWMIDADSYELDPRHPLVQIFERSVSLVGIESRIRGVETHTDAGRLGYLAGLPTVTFGPGDMRFAHQIDEHVVLDDVVEASKVYATATLLWTSRDVTE